MIEELPLSSWSQDHVSRCYPASSLVRAHASVLNPPLAYGLPLVNGSVPVAVSPGWEEDLPDVALHIFPCVLGPLPRQLVWCAYPFLPTRQRPSPRSDRVGAQQHPYSDFSTARFSRLQSFTHVQARRCAHHPGRSYRYGQVRRAAVVSPSEPLVGRYLPTPRICLPSESGN
jgi:hypothetical protein